MMLWKPALVIAVLLLSGCVPRHAVVTPELRTQMMADLKAGKPNLTCEIECAFSWMDNFQRMITLHNASQWEALAELVMQVGHGRAFPITSSARRRRGWGTTMPPPSITRSVSSCSAVRIRSNIAGMCRAAITAGD